MYCSGNIIFTALLFYNTYFEVILKLMIKVRQTVVTLIVGNSLERPVLLS